MKKPRRLADNVLASIRNFERDCACPTCRAGTACVNCEHCLEQLTSTIGQVLGLAGAQPIAVQDSAQRPLFGAEVIEFRPRDKKPCKPIPAPGERKA